MAGWDDVTTYEQTQAMTPEENEIHFDSCIVWDPSALPGHLRLRRAAQTEAFLAREAQSQQHAS